MKREGEDIICIQETHVTDAHRFTIRGYELFRHDRTDRHKGGVVWISIPAVEVERSGGDSEYLAIRVVVHGWRKDQGSPQVMARKDWLTQHRERHTEGLESDKSPDWRPAACPKSRPFEGRYPDLDRQEGCLLACRQFPRGQPTWYLKGETSRHQNEDQGTTTEKISNPQHDNWVLHPWAELCHQTAKNKKAPGKDGISNEIIRHLGSVAKQKLLDIYNHSWNTGTFATSWKEAIIIPILKKGKDRHSKTSYRPISLLSCLGKTMERMMNRRIQHHLEKNGLLSPSQSGFRKNTNPEDQARLHTQDIENGFQLKMKTLAVFVDLTKAFDTVWKEDFPFKLLRKSLWQHVLIDPDCHMATRTDRSVTSCPHTSHAHDMQKT